LVLKLFTRRLGRERIRGGSNVGLQPMALRSLNGLPAILASSMPL